MKWLFIIAGLAAVIYFGILAAIQTGEKSPKFVEGVMSLPKELESKTTGINTLFLVIYDLDSPRPMPYGAVKFRLADPVKAGEFFPFVVTKEKLQVMGGMGAAPPKRMRLKARLDRDGFGGGDQPGDITGEIPEVAFGSSGILISLNKLVGN
jgi:hypothetical protein